MRAHLLSALIPILGIAAYAQPWKIYRVEGSSMEPSLKPGQILLTLRVDRQIRRGDVVIFRHGGEAMVKRVMFVGGDEFPMFKLAGVWFGAATKRALNTAAEKMELPQKTVRVPYGSVYVVGDNWIVSMDSRQFGPVPLEDVERIVESSTAPEVPYFAGAKLRLRGYQAKFAD
jgi:signal peptidase I